MVNLIIVESSAKAKKIGGFLGGNYIVSSCQGHVQDLPGPKYPDRKQANKAMWAASEDSLPSPPWPWVVDQRGRSAEMVIKPLLEKARKKKADKVFIATDPDREGEFIAWRLSEIFGDFSTQRITFNEITENAVVAALSDPRSVDESLVNAAKVRRFMDRLVGFRSSKFSKSWSLKSMGRVQTPTLGFIVERELEREAFVPQPFYAVDAEAGGLTFKARFHEKEDPDAWFDRDAEPPKHHPYRTNDLSLANLARSTINEEGGVQVTNTKDGTRSSSPKPPFSTPSLLRTAGSHPKIGWGSKKIMQVASSLYNAGHITYMRTDSTRTNPEARSEVRQYIVSQWGSEHLRPEPGVGGEVQKVKKKEYELLIKLLDHLEKNDDINKVFSNLDWEKLQ